MAAVGEVTHAAPFDIAWRMPYAETAYFVVQALRKAGVKNIREPNRMEEVMARLEQLMQDYTNEKFNGKA